MIIINFVCVCVIRILISKSTKMSPTHMYHWFFVFHFLFHIRKEYRWYLIIDNEPNFFVSCRALLLNFVIFFSKIENFSTNKKNGYWETVVTKKKTDDQWHNMSMAYVCVCVGPFTKFFITQSHYMHIWHICVS